MKKLNPQSLKGRYEQRDKKTNIALFFNGHQLKGRSSSTLHKMVNQLNSTFRLCSNLKPLNPTKYSINPNDIMSRDSLNAIKKEKYNKQWKLDNYRLPTLSNEEHKKNKKAHSQSQIITSSTKLRNRSSNNNANKNDGNNSPYYGLMLDEATIEKINTITIGGAKMEALSMLKSFCPPMNTTTSAMIMNKSILEACGENPIKKYTNNLKDILGAYVNYADKYSSIFDLDKWIRDDMVKYKTGISLPGNILNMIEGENRFKNLKVFQPNNVKTRIARCISIPEKTQLPRHPGLIKRCSKITYKDVYS